MLTVFKVAWCRLLHSNRLESSWLLYSHDYFIVWTVCTFANIRWKWQKGNHSCLGKMWEGRVSSLVYNFQPQSLPVNSSWKHVEFYLINCIYQVYTVMFSLFTLIIIKNERQGIDLKILYDPCPSRAHYLWCIFINLFCYFVTGLQFSIIMLSALSPFAFSLPCNESLIYIWRSNMFCFVRQSFFV